MVMRNEYGVRIGQVKVENNENLISLNDEKLFYSISTDNDPKVIFYKDSIDFPFAVCDLKVDNDKNLLPAVKTSATQHSLLLALCWYLFHPVTKETRREFA
jgi:hypothetical protein